MQNKFCSLLCYFLLSIIVLSIAQVLGIIYYYTYFCNINIRCYHLLYSCYNFVLPLGYFYYVESTAPSFITEEQQLTYKCFSIKSWLQVQFTEWDAPSLGLDTPLLSAAAYNSWQLSGFCDRCVSCQVHLSHRARKINYPPLAYNKWPKPVELITENHQSIG
jgi:hypothetical protein